MIGNTREDDLLSKLKSCIGSLKSDNAAFQESRAAKTIPAMPKENYPAYNTNPIKANNIQSNPKYSKVNNYTSMQRQPLTVPNYTMPTPNYPPVPSSYPHSSRAELPLNQNRFQMETRPYPQKNEEFRTSQTTTPRKFDYNFQGERQQKYPGRVDSSQKFVRSKQEVRGQISRRYSLVQNEREPSKYPQHTQYTGRLPTRNYQQQVEERKQLLQSALERKEKTPAQRDYLPVGNSYNPSPNPVRMGTISSTRKQPIYQGREVKGLVAQMDYSSRKEPPMMIKETLQRAFEESSNPNECSALAKLRKISELNEKINDRIRNIINVFEEHKC